MTMDANAVIAEARAHLDPGLRRAIDLFDPRNRRVAEYHLGFANVDGSLIDSPGGKRIRGVLGLLSGQAVGGAAVDALPAAVGIELVHQHSLLHDDLIDEDEVRRHRPAAWTVFGPAAAILAGDAMLGLALEIAAGPVAVLRSRTVAGPPATMTAATAVPDTAPPGGLLAMRHLAMATRRMLAGQAADVAFESEPVVSLADCQQMVADKTGALLVCAASIGAVAVGAPQSVVAGLQEFGRHIGMAFQLVDDLLGLWGRTDDTGKPVASDLASRKKSLPVVAALSAAGPDARRLAEIYAADEPLDADEVAVAVAAVEAAGGRAWAQREADLESTAALTVLDTVDIYDDVREKLRAMTLMLCRRSS